MIQFSVRQLDAIKTPVMDKVLLLYKFYLVSFLICLAAALTGLAYLIMTAIQSCSVQQIHIFTIISVVFYLCLVFDMLLSEKATLKFFNDNCRNLDLTQNTVFKTFLQSVERLRYYSNQREVSVFQVREVLWNSMSIRFHKFFFMSQVVCWILYGISFFFAINQVGKGCVHKNESLIVFIIYLYHNFWFIILVGFSIVVSVSAILFLPFLICAYFRFNDKSEIPEDPEEQQKIFLQNQLENFKYDSTKAKDTLCAICLEDFQTDSPVKRTKCCKSIYHPVCIKEWVVNSITCPNCRKTPFTKNKGQDVRIDSVVPLNQNQVNTEVNQNQPNQEINIVQQGQDINQQAAGQNDVNRNPDDIENQNQQLNQQNEGEQGVQEQNQNEQVQQDFQQQAIEMEVIRPNKNEILSNQPQNVNVENQESYIIQLSDISGNLPQKRNHKIKDINEIHIQNNDIDDIPIQVVEEAAYNKRFSIDNQNVQNDSSTNSKDRKKFLSTNTQGDGMNTMNNNLISELHGQRLTINYNQDAMAANSTEISTQKIPVHHKHTDLQSHNVGGVIDNYDIQDFENINEYKDTIDMR